MSEEKEKPLKTLGYSASRDKPNDNDEEEDTEDETENGEEANVRGSADIGGITLEWPDPPIDFKDYGPAAEIEFPILMLPYGNGRQLIYSTEDQQTYWEKTPPAWWIIFNTSRHLYGEEFRPDIGKVKAWLNFVIHLRNPNFGGLDAATWLINDVYDTDQDAVQRAYIMANMGPQPIGSFVSRVYQANSTETFNKYLTAFKDAGFMGALLRPLEHMIGEPEFVAFDLLED